MPREINPDFYASAKKMSEQNSDKVSLLAYGKAGTGKTQLGGTFPKLLVIDLDGGLLTIKDTNYKSIPITGDMPVYQTCLMIIQDAKFKRGPFAKGGEYEDRESIFLDSFSELSAQLFVEIMEEQKKDTRAAYQLLLKRLTTLTSLFRELKLYGYNVIGSAGETAKENILTHALEPVPLIDGSFRDHIAHMFDLSLWMEVQTRNGKPTYYAYSVTEKGRAAKSRVPIPSKIENITYDTIIKAINNK